MINFIGKWVYCHFNECCKPRWTNHTPHEIASTFKDTLIGQHLVEKIVAKSVYKHVIKNDPDKALVLSFHGWTGCGKNFVADIVAKHIYKEGVKSKYITKYIAGNDFPNKENIKVYKEKLKSDIIRKTTNCERSLFVFDEIEKMPPGLLDVLKPFVDHHREINGINYRKNIFIFIGNTGGEEVNREVFRHFRAGHSREEITSKQMEKILSTDAFNNEGGLKDANILLANLVDFFVPFLPMEREHVKQCVRAELLRRDEHETVDEKIVNKVAEEMEYFPSVSPIFCSSGCKRVAKKIDMIID